MLDSKKGQISGGLITAIVFGIASLVIGVIIAFVITSTLSGAGLLTSTRTSATVTNETGADINVTGYTLGGVTTNPSYLSGSFVITTAFNSTDNSTILLTNITTSADGVVTNATPASLFADVSLSYTYTIQSAEEVATTGLTTNFTAGVDNVSLQIPTVLLVAAIVLIIGVLAILVAVWQKMRLGGVGAGL